MASLIAACINSAKSFSAPPAACHFQLALLPMGAGALKLVL